MIVCHCKAVSDRQVRAAVRAGASRRGAVARACGAGTVCGGCRPVIDEIVSAETVSGAGAGTDDAAGVRLAPSR